VTRFCNRSDIRWLLKQTQKAIYPELTARPQAGGIKKPKNLVRFGTVGILDGPQVIVPQGLGA